MEQFDQLLTCCVCLDRYRNPKLLPCQHSFCMEPCMEGLVDYVRRQVKCPECRAEHRIPYQGVQAFPTNVTLQRFLELHIDLTGELPDPTSNQVMERCQVCSEKAYVNPCAHCDKKVCPDCKDAHLDVLKREITRLSSQVRRVLHRLEDALSVTDKNLGGLKGTQIHVFDEVDDLVRRFTKAIKDKGDALRRELESYVTTEITTLNGYKSNLQTEISNIQSNCDLVDKHMVCDTPNITWDDQELMDTKDIFLKTIEFIRNFEYEPGERRIRFQVNQDPNTIIIGLSNFGDLILPTSITSHHASLMPPPMQQQPMQSGGIMRSKSDHRLVQQYRDMDEMDEKPSRTSKYSKYGSDDNERKGFRSRFTRRLMDDDDSRVRFNDGDDDGPSSSGRAAKPTRARVIETDDAIKGPLSGVGRLLDSTRVLEKMVESETGKKKPASIAGPTVPLAIQQQMQVLQQQQLLQQQHQAQNAAGITTPPAASASSTTAQPAPWRASQEKSSTTKSGTVAAAAAATPVRKPSTEKKRSESESSSSDHQSGSSSSTSSSSHRSVATGAPFSTEEVKQRYLKGNTPQKAAAAAASSTKSSSPASSNKFRRNVTPVSSLKKDDGSESSSEESESESDEPAKPAVTSASAASTGRNRSSGAAGNAMPKMEKTDIGPLLARSAVARERDPPVSTRARAMSRDEGSGVSRQTSRDSDHLASSSSARSRHAPEETTTSSRSRDPPSSSASSALERRMSRDDTNTSSGAGSAYRDYKNRQQKSPPERTYGSSSTGGSGAGSTASRYGSSSTSSPYDYGISRSRTGTALYEPPETTSRLQSKYLNRSRHNLGSSFDQSDYHPTPSSSSIHHHDSSSSRPSGNPYYTGRTSYLTKQDNENQRSSNSRERSRDKAKILSRSKSSHELVPGETNDPKTSGGATPEDEQSSLSSWARYLKSKYGKTSNSGNNSGTSGSGITGLGSSGEGSGDTSGLGGISGPGASPGMGYRGKSSSPQKLNLATSQYSQKKRLTFKFGVRGSDPGQFTWPRGIACGPDNSIVVADSSNHRIQVFDQHGTFVKDFGQYGNGDGEFDCLAGVAINRIGQFIVSDRYNHRIQVFDPSGRFLRAFGSQGSTDGKFNYPWGVTTDALGFIYVCDKENHRVQVFQSDGTFVGKFGVGELEHPHYIGVTCTNKVVVSDTGHHRVFIFDVNGKIIGSIGTEGIENGQFKLPRGVAVDEQGYIFVGDSGNNRIQIFNPDGHHIRSFGGWGCGDGEFKGLEGIAVNSNGNILVCDRENHRIQAF